MRVRGILAVDQIAGHGKLKLEDFLNFNAVFLKESMSDVVGRLRREGASNEPFAGEAFKHLLMSGAFCFDLEVRFWVLGHSAFVLIHPLGLAASLCLLRARF